MIKKNPWKFYHNNLVVIAFLIASVVSQAQILNQQQLDTCRVIKSLEEAMLSPLSVYILDLSKKKLQHLPVQISQFENLQVLKLAKNKISKIDTTIVLPKYIQEINLSKNELDNFPLALSTLKHLRTLILNQNMIENVPDQIENLKELKYLDMWSNNLSKISENIKLLTKLEELDLRVIILSSKEKKRIENLLPNTKVHFSNSCNCGY